jgi:lauroyl/myristoyl acyltransferase
MRTTYANGPPGDGGTSFLAGKLRGPIPSGMNGRATGDAGDRERYPGSVTARPPQTGGSRRCRRLLRAIYLQLLQSKPAATLTMMGVLGRLANALYPHYPLPENVAELFPGLPRHRLLEIARQTRLNIFKEVGLLRLLECRVDALIPLVRCCGGSLLQRMYARRQPAILGSWHWGAFFLTTIVPALKGLGISALFVGKDLKYRLPPNIEVCEAKGDSVTRVKAVKRAHEHLRAGGMVVIALDGQEGDSTLEVPCLGRRIRLRRGPAILARLSGAPLIPITQHWEPYGGKVRLTVHDPLPSPACPPEEAGAFDHALLAEVARWFESTIYAKVGCYGFSNWQHMADTGLPQP